MLRVQSHLVLLEFYANFKYRSAGLTMSDVVVVGGWKEDGVARPLFWIFFHIFQLLRLLRLELS